MTIQEILFQEEAFQFDKFNFKDALFISNHILKECINDDGKPIGIQISLHNQIIYYCLMDGKKESKWLDRKSKTVSDSQHCSLFTFLNKELNETFFTWSKSEEYAVCGGGFPIKINGVIVGSICVSGREHIEDHELIIKALKEHKSQCN